MTSYRRFTEPPIWDDADLERHRREAVAEFINERTNEGSVRYRAVYAANLALVRHLFVASNDLLDLWDGAALAALVRFVEAAT